MDNLTWNDTRKIAKAIHRKYIFPHEVSDPAAAAERILAAMKEAGLLSILPEIDNNSQKEYLRLIKEMFYQLDEEEKDRLQDLTCP